MAKKSLIAKAGRAKAAAAAAVKKEKEGGAPATFTSRAYNRCSRCGRRRGYIRKFKLCRLCFRELALQGRIPGVTKASW